MELCSDGHEEICYEGRVCPVCEKLDEIEQLDLEIASANTEIQELGDSLLEMEANDG